MRVIIDFFRHDAAVGIILLITAAAALILDNSPLAPIYDMLLTTPFSISLGDAGLDKPLLLWINDGLMAVFFFLVGLEIKREVLSGELSSPQKVALPAIAAVGGMVVPAAFYLMFAGGNPDTINGWAIPAATDIAFALGILALLGSRVPTALKVFLLALAIIDDLGAIIIIAMFYTENLSLYALGLSSIGIIALITLNRFNVMKAAPYILIGIFIWVCVLKSGVHATLAGVAVALTIPMRGKNAPLEHLEHALHPWVYFMIMPIFAFANAGVALHGLGLDALLQPVTLGIAAGLAVGKPVGILAFIGVATALKLCRLPDGITWPAIAGVACLAGIGFTMSLFIGTLAFSGPELAAQVRIGVIAGSTVSALLGIALLRMSLPAPGHTERLKAA